MPISDIQAMYFCEKTQIFTGKDGVQSIFQIDMQPALLLLAVSNTRFR